MTDQGDELRSAAAAGDTAKVEELVKAGVPVDAVDRIGESALRKASEFGHTTTVRTLVQLGADINMLDPYIGRSALYWASTKGHPDTVRTLVQLGADLNMTDDLFGDSALHLASREGHTDTVRALVQLGADINMISERDGDTPLHTACGRYDPSEPKRIEACVVLIDAGADYQKTNRSGKTPIDVIGAYTRTLKIDSEEAKPIRKAMERQEYHLLLESSLPVKVVKVFLIGDIKAGKTTIKKALTMESKAESHSYIPTPGIDVGSYMVDGVGRLSLWDAAGHVEYHMTHGMFLGSRYSIAVVVYNLQEQHAFQRLGYWLRFLRSGQRKTDESKLKIIIVATHLDAFNEHTDAQLLAERNLNDVRSFFGNELDIELDLIVVNGRLPQSTEMIQFRNTLKKAHDVIKTTRNVPKLCEEIMDKKITWVSSSTPVVLYEEYKDKVKEIDPLASDKLIKISANYLQDMGELFLAYDGSQLTRVVLDTQWLAFRIIGPTLAGHEFDGQIELLASKSCYSKTELELFFKDIADFPTVSQLLQNLDLLVTFDDINFTIPCKVRQSTSMKNIPKYGRTIFCENNKSMMSPSVFPVVQARIMKAIGSKNDQPLMRKEFMQFLKQAVGLTEERNGIDAINFGVAYDDNDPESSFQDLERISGIIVTAMYELSPGSCLETGYLSPKSIQRSHNLHSLHNYTMKEIETGENAGGTVYHKSMEVNEKTSDILIKGGDPYFIRQKGFDCDIKWMLNSTQRQLYQLLDITSCLRKDYRSLAEFLGIEDSILEAIEQKCSRNKTSYTEAIIGHWTSVSGNSMTFRSLYRLLTHPGLVYNIEAAKVIEDAMNAFGYQATSLRSNPAGLPDMLLLWRAIVRQVYDVMRRHVNPTDVARSVLTEDDANMITHIERNEGRLQGVDKLVSQLLKRKDLRWTNSFPSALKDQHPDAFDAVTKAREQHLKHDVFSRCRYTVCNTITSDGGVLELHEFGVRLEIPKGALQKKEDISVSVVSPKDNHPPLGDTFIIAPIVQLEPDGLQFLRPVTLTVKHSGIDLKLRKLQVWNRTGNRDWQVIFDGKDGSTDPNIQLKGNTLKIRRKGFCWYCWFAWCTLDVQIMPFVEKDLLSSNTVTLSVFALTNHDACMVENEIDSKKQILAFGKPMRRYLLSTCKNLQISVMGVKDRQDDAVWDLVNRSEEKEPVPAAKEITHRDLQFGVGHSCCEFLFKKVLGHDVDSIWCDLEISQQDKRPLEFRMKHIMDIDDVLKYMSRLRLQSSISGAGHEKYRSDKGEDKLSDEDIRLVTHKAHLVKADLDNLFGELSISAADQERGRRNADTRDFQLRAKQILYIWRQNKGKAATRNTVIEALHRCRIIAAVEFLNEKWSLTTV